MNYRRDQKEIKEFSNSNRNQIGILDWRIDFGLESQMKRKKTQTGYNQSEREETPPSRV